MYHENSVSRESEAEAKIYLVCQYVTIILGDPFISEWKGYFSTQSFIHYILFKKLQNNAFCIFETK